MGWGWSFRPYVPVAKRKANALREVKRLAGKGKAVLPVEIAGRTIVTTFWGKAWCDNLESYSDFSNRLPRGRTYVRNGSVVDLQIEPGKITSMVSGSSLYRITILIKPLAAVRWSGLKKQCGAQIGSVVELLQGRLSTSVMGLVTSRASGLFPAPAEVEMSCSCPDWATMCKHVAATLYGVGNRLDRSPELLFTLRQVDHLDLITEAGQPVAATKRIGKKTIASDQLSEVFGIELDTVSGTANSDSSQPAQRNGRAKRVEPEKKKAIRATTTKSKEEAAQAPKRTRAPQSKTLTPKERKQLAETIKQRWESQKKSSKNGGGALSSPAPAKKSAKAKPAKSTRGKSSARTRAN